MPKDIRVVAIIAAYNEEDVIGQVVRHLIDEGIGVYLIDNGSTDRTVAEVEPHRERGVLGIESFPAPSADLPVDRFAWERLLRRKEALARELRADWLIHHDADEFRESPWRGTTLRDAIAEVDASGYNAIDFQVLNFLPTNGEFRIGDDVREKLLFYEPARVTDRVQIKCWKNRGQLIDLAGSGGHEVLFADRRVFPIRFLLRHYPIRSQTHGQRKVLRDRIPRFDPNERARGWHVQYDNVSDDTRFVRDPDELVRYDADLVRMALQVRHRGVEELEQAVETATESADSVRSQLTAIQREMDAERLQFEALQRHLTTQDSELERLRPVVAEQEAQLQELRRHLSAQDEELDRLRPLVTVQQTHIDEIRQRLIGQEAAIERLRGEIRDGRRDLDALLASKSWKLTAPLRAVYRVVMRRPR